MAKDVIYFSDMLKIMNHAILNNEKVSFKAWRVGGSEDPERGEARTYNNVYVTSHSKYGTYNVLDPLAMARNEKFRHIHECCIFEFMNKKVIW